MITIQSRKGKNRIALIESVRFLHLFFAAKNRYNTVYIITCFLVNWLNIARAGFVDVDKAFLLSYNFLNRTFSDKRYQCNDPAN